ncbi:MAG: YihA family ribosome biogenesis GTP-binding protein [Clostridia bacterium]|nr:YihA family ribosome biogenesis GTP-binding protein [Clostridia bacterium]
MNLNNASFFASFGTAEQLPEPKCPEICFSGRSNVGKSSLINRLLSRKAIARVSSTPGKTTTVNFFSCDGIFLVDLPGYGYAKVDRGERARWDALMNAYFSGGRDIRVCIQLLDIRRTLSGDDERMISFLKNRNIPFAAVLTKCDKLNKTELAKQTEYWQTLLRTVPVFPFSALTGTGKQEILDFIERQTE